MHLIKELTLEVLGFFCVLVMLFVYRQVAKWMEGESCQYNELKAIQEGVVYALKEGIRLLEIETDTVTLVKILKEESPPWCLVNCVRNTYYLFEKFQAVKIAHISREGNRCAHWLAAHAKASKYDQLPVGDCHPELADLLCSDKQGIVGVRFLN